MFDFISILLLSFAIDFGVILALYKLSLGPKVNKNRSLMLSRLTIILYAPLLFASAYSVVTIYRHFVWLYIYGAFVGTAVLYILFSANSSKRMQYCVLSLPLLVIATSLAINGPAPLTSDEGRFTGFGFRILEEGRWIPFKYDENTYYQYFNVVPFLKASVSMVTGLDMINAVHPFLVLWLTFFTTLVIFALSRKILNMERDNSRFLTLAALSPILFLSTPPVSTIGFIPQWLSVSLYLLTFQVVLHGSNSRAHLVLVLMLVISGVPIHATYPILLLTTLGALMLMKVLKGVKISGIFIYTIIFTLTYWIHTLIMESVTIWGKDWLSRFVELASGGVIPFAITQAEYSAAPPWMLYPWALLPSFTLCIIFLMLAGKILKNKIMNASERFIVGLGVFGLLFLALGFVSRTFSPTHVALVRYSYPAYFLLLPASIYVIKEIFSKGRMLSILMIALIITASAFCAIQDFMFSPDMYRITTDADKRSWIIAEDLVPLLSSNVGYLFDTRIGIGIEALTLRDSPELYGKKYEETQVVVVNLDSVGEANLNFWFGPEWVKIIQCGNYSIIFSDGCYKAYMKIGEQR